MRTWQLALVITAGLQASLVRAEVDDDRGPTVEITLQQVVERARSSSPAVTLARGRSATAQSRVVAASVPSYNPEFTAAVGPRSGGDDGSTVDWGVEAVQWFEIGGERRARIDAARSRVDAEIARLEDAARTAARDAALSYADFLYWRRRVALADRRVELAAELVRVARERRAIGEAGALDESLAEIALIRAHADQARVGAARIRAEHRLAIEIGLSADAKLVSRETLASLASAPLPELPSSLPARPEVRALQAELRAAQAGIDEARGMFVPDVAVGASFEREESQDIVQARFGIELPVFDRGQGNAAVAVADVQRLRAAEEVAAERVAAEREAAAAAAEILVAAAQQAERELDSLVVDVDERVRASQAEGAVPLVTALAVRREVIDAEREHAELLLSAARARIERRAAIGELP